MEFSRSPVDAKVEIEGIVGGAQTHVEDERLHSTRATTVVLHNYKTIKLYEHL